ncbi:MAG: 16S rRNA (guanine(966)-N(2))-methyltransferase RsmD [Christensenellaceae bacterium]|nr:16S rRNA (guanine(966)-N(2))-methyltransferase RsmD [Christensenellaceae bacterium]
MRIIAGIAKSRPILSPKGMGTRPTQDYIREALFNIIIKHVPDAVCLDLFGGSGALGLEAISRGAEHCVFCDKSYDAINTIKNNIKNLKFEEQSTLIKGDWEACLNKIADKNIKFDLVFLDPPYDFKKYSNIFETFNKLNLINDDALVVLEQEKSLDVAEYDGFSHIDSRDYGITRIHFYKRRPVNE